MKSGARGFQAETLRLRVKPGELATLHDSHQPPRLRLQPGAACPCMVSQSEYTPWGQICAADPGAVALKLRPYGAIQICLLVLLFKRVQLWRGRGRYQAAAARNKKESPLFTGRQRLPYTVRRESPRSLRKTSGTRFKRKFT